MLNTNQPFELVNFWEKIQPIRNKMAHDIEILLLDHDKFCRRPKKKLSLFYKSFELVVLEKKKYILIFVIQKQELLMVSIFYYRSIQTV